MSVRADNGRHFSVEKPPQGNFFARRLAMRINDDVRRLCANLCNCCFDGTKWVVQDRLHERASLHIDYANFSLSSFEHDRSSARCAVGIIYRAQQTRLGVYERKNLFLIPDMIAAGNYRNTAAQELDRDFPSNTAAARGVLAVDDDEIQRVFRPQLRQAGNNGGAPWLANNVAKKENG